MKAKSAWFKRLAQKLPKGLHGLLGKPIAERLPEFIDVTDPRFAIRPFEDGDWLCPFCSEHVLTPQWNGSSLDLIEQPEVFAHLCNCSVVSNVGVRSIPKAKPWEVLVEKAVRLRVAASPNYRVTDAGGTWICPHCLKPGHALMRNWDGTDAPVKFYLDDLYRHLRACPAFMSSPLEPLDDFEVRQAALSDQDLRQKLLRRVICEPIFRVTDDEGYWIDPFSEQAVMDINLQMFHWDAVVQNRIVDYLLGSACPGQAVGFRVSQTVEELSRIGGRLSAQRQGGGTAEISAAAEAELNFLRPNQQVAGSPQGFPKDVQVAREVLLRMLPRKTPEIPGYEVANFWAPCSDLGGDMFGYLDAGGGKTGFLIVSVSGHGVADAMILSMTMKTFSVRSEENPSPAAVLSAVNADLVNHIPQGKFVTAFYAVLDPVVGVLTYANAGHPSALLADPTTGEVRKLEGLGIALGLAQPAAFNHRVQEFQAPLPLHGVLLLYANGMVAAQDENQQPSGVEPLSARLVQVAQQPAQQIVADLSTCVRQHLDTQRAADHLTLVAVKRVGLRNNLA